MNIKDIDCIEHVRRQAGGRCEVCGDPGNAVHHVWAKGMGGSPIDLPINLINLCNTCHYDHHCGKAPVRLMLIGLIECREGWKSNEIEEEIYRVRQLPQGSEYRPTRPFATYHRYRGRGDGVQRDPAPPRVGCGRPGVAFDEGGWFRLS